MGTHRPAAFVAWALLRQAREQAGLSQRQLAEVGGTSQSAIARYERARSLPDIATLDRLIRACGMELHWRLSPPDKVEDDQLRSAIAQAPEVKLRGNYRLTRLTGLAGTGSHGSASRSVDGQGFVPLDARSLLAELNRHKVPYIVIGRLAALLHGSGEITQDLDIAVPSCATDRVRLHNALVGLDAVLLSSERTTSAWRAQPGDLSDDVPLSLRTRHGDIDVFLDGADRSLPYRFEELAGNAERITVDGRHVRIAALQDVLRMKEESGRTKDLASLRRLFRLDDMLHEMPAERSP